MIAHFGTEILMAVDARRERDEFGNRLRFALVTADPERWLNDLFPELARARQASQDRILAETRKNLVDLDPDEDLQAATGSWDFSQVHMSEDEVRDVLSSMGGYGKLTPADVASSASRDGWR